MKKTGLLGGTFDPPHIGHLLMAEEASVQCGLEEVWWLPNSRQPLKQDSSASEEDRLRMVEAMASLSAQFSVCREEVDRSGASYTLDTIEALKQKHPDREFYFIMGADSLESFQRWDRWTELREMLPFIVLSRPGQDMAPASSIGFADVRILDTLAVDISSSELRERAWSGNWNQFYVTSEVNRLIKEHGLYDDRT
ncbi:nicotinate-nucleotide adenylyltransferase [Alkalicoccus chagannorensis]|uniref:nicotinate-nucleotide adenylyltransferase n=1 Tax=Alkalicoccus chagannorensis TaxID=427072 RepID=UPI0004294DB8|nr:nicotinate-nucleotide adenylyltransferase [Alkalicoccus chagannorensis]